jgi:hypothetical protein
LDREVKELIELSDEFMKLDNVYGGGRYRYTMFVRLGDKEKEVVYISSLHSSEMPVAFRKLKDKLFELANRVL